MQFICRGYRMRQRMSCPVMIRQLSFVRFHRHAESQCWYFRSCRKFSSPISQTGSPATGGVGWILYCEGSSRLDSTYIWVRQEAIPVILCRGWCLNPAIHLGIEDIAVDNCQQPAMLRVSIKVSKTYPFRKGVEVFVGCVASSLCPIAAVMDYIPLHVGCWGWSNVSVPGWSSILSQATLCICYQGGFVAGRPGSDKVLYAQLMHIGAATTAASKGIEDAVIKALGWWESLAYLQYIRLPWEQLAAVQVSSVTVCYFLYAHLTCLVCYCTLCSDIFGCFSLGKVVAAPPG